MPRKKVMKPGEWEGMGPGVDHMRAVLSGKAKGVPVMVYEALDRFLRQKPDEFMRVLAGMEREYYRAMATKHGTRACKPRPEGSAVAVASAGPAVESVVVEDEMDGADRALANWG